MLLKINDEASLKKLIQESSNKVVLLYFWASWSNIGQSVLHTIIKIEEQLENKAIIALLNVENNKDIESDYNIKFIPTLLSFRDGKLSQ